MNTTAVAHSPLGALHEQMQCFALPFGVIGFVMHLLANWMLFYLICDESIWRGDTIKYPLMNFSMGSMGLLGGLGISIYNAIRCRDSWPLILISVWKAGFVIATNGASMLANWALSKGEDNANAVFALLMYPTTIIIGLVGLGAIAREGWEDYRMKIVCALSIVTFTTLTIGMRFFIGRENPGKLSEEFGEWTVGLLMGITMMSGMACDWILAVAANNLDGVPSGRDMEVIASFVFYFVAALIPVGNG
ncbi:uncharacterized protein BDR25DRAFT_339180 [Lindgomyces ingoldianus]|uniref:Uncharacterized protein n=1 Tax=Lindgomyces ingoldianus TaxID=673940 RepID=A0ACB6RD34_9PLEO|nr:uncharacterized protein BDR25DRAFT_339180 [Lindgomyces ingoldianus]KAF2477193.1 hypothetical protein BDR25DRAFT_339180 [Lindgomyces ingoldianus]